MYKVTQVILLANIHPVEKHFTIAKKQYINFPPSWYPSSPHLFLALEDFKFSHFKRSTPLLYIKVHIRDIIFLCIHRSGRNTYLTNM